jgi:hypothetical protein
MPAFRKQDEYEPETPPLSPNRQALVDLNKARAAAKTEVETEQARMNTLARLKDAVAPIEGELAALDAAEADALAQWSVSPATPAPQPDIAARADIMTRLQSARQQVAGAQLATASVESVLARANDRAAELERSVPALVAAVLLDSARDLLPGIVEATMALAKAQGRYATLRKFLLERAEAAKDVAARNGFFRDLEALDREAHDAAGIAPLLSFNAGAEWKLLAESLGDVPILPTPTLPAAFPGMPILEW